MIIHDLFELASPKPKHVWSKRGKAVEKRVEREPDTRITGRTQLAVKDNKNG
jgi:hypothetical protein